MPKPFLLAIFFFLFFHAGILAQTDTNETVPFVDTIDRNDPVPPAVQPEPRRDTVPATRAHSALKDSVSKRPASTDGWDLRPFISDHARLTAEIFRRHPWLGFSTTPELIHAERRYHKGKELYFYAMVGLLLLFAIMRNAFSKYFNDLFRVFFRTTLKQRQIREQLMQTPLPSLMFNVFFFITGGLYLAFVLDYYDKNPAAGIWELAAYCCAGISIAYLVKFIGLKILGMIFGIPNAVTAYIFVVFIINKMIGILLLPFIILLAFAQEPLYSISLKLSFVLLAGLLIYRLVLTFAAIRNQIKLNPFHFILYVASFEVAPLILVYKALLRYFPEMA